MEIDWISVILGIVAIGFGCFTLYLRSSAPEKLGKLTAMKEFWGEKKGNIIHLLAYTVAPIVFGIVFLLQAFTAI